MTLPVIERIANEVQKRLNPVVPDRNKLIGQATTVRTGRVIPDAASVIVQQQPSRPLPQLNYQGNPAAVAFECTFNIQCFIENKTTELEFAQQCNRVVADVVRLITNPEEDPVMWYSFENLAINASFGIVRDLLTEIGVHGGVIVPLVIQYRVSETDHTQVR
jgi:hypothetical protein